MRKHLSWPRGEIWGADYEYFWENWAFHKGSSLYLFTVIAVIVLVFAYGQVGFWLMASFRQVYVIRQQLFSAIMRQEIGWFDTHESGELNTRMSE